MENLLTKYIHNVYTPNCLWNPNKFSGLVFGKINHFLGKTLKWIMRFLVEDCCESFLVNMMTTCRDIECTLILEALVSIESNWRWNFCSFIHEENCRVSKCGYCLKGIVHQLWIYNIFFVSKQKKHFLLLVHLDKTTLTRNNWENRVLKGNPSKYCYIYYIYL